MSAENIANLMAGGASPTQVSQTAFRLRLLESWSIPAGSRVLEVGCGQGDMTAVLADAVGESGSVTAVDIADPSYGAPINLADSAKFLKEGSLGERIDFRFNFDVLDPQNEFPENSFDVAVLAHCSWYFSSPEQLGAVFTKLRKWASKLCFSEWNMEPARFEQVAHLLAVLIQGQIEMHKPVSESNIRNPLARAELREVMSGAGWEVQKDEDVSSEGIEDAKWEVGHCLRISKNEIPNLNLPEREVRFLNSQLAVLESLSKRTPFEPMPSYSIFAIA